MRILVRPFVGGRLAAVPMATLLALAGTVCAQGVQSSAVVSPQLQFGIHEDFTFVPPTSITGAVPIGSLLWAAPSVAGTVASGAPAIELVHPDGSSRAEFAYEMTSSPTGDELTVRFDYLARLWHTTALGILGETTVDGGAMLYVTSDVPQACGVVLTAHIATIQPPDQGHVQVDLGDDGVIELDGAVVFPWQGPSADFAAYGHLELGPVPQPIRIGGAAIAVSDGGTRIVTVHVELRFVPALGAAVAPFGVGCSAGSWTPQLMAAAGSLPQLGATFTQQVIGLPDVPAPFVAGLLGVDDQMFAGVPLPLDLGWAGMPGCVQYLAPLPDLIYVEPSAGGVASWSLPFPPVYDLAGLVFFSQVLVDAPGANALGLVTTNALRAVLGL